jgi:ribose/xylose/arabinose/galactoside ABC-type transport system permease subunit
MTDELDIEPTLMKRRFSLRGIWRALGPLLALALIIVGFTVASQIKGGIDRHRMLVERAARQAADGQTVEAVPSRWECIKEHENRFFTVNTFRATGNQTVAVGIAAMGMTMIIISGGIDLSVGSVMALTSVVLAWWLNRGPPDLRTIIYLLGNIATCVALLALIHFIRLPKWLRIPLRLPFILLLWLLVPFLVISLLSHPLPVLSAALAALVVGSYCGRINATMITHLKVVPFIATLGMWGMARGAAKGLAGEQKIDAPMTWLGESILVRRPNPEWLILSPGVWTMLILAVLVWALLRYTALGRHIYALGSNEATARLCGIKVERTKLYLYSIAGITTGLAGVMQFCRLTVGDPTTAMGAELDVIAAVVIGGGSLSGGQGSVFGSLIGALIMAFLRVGCDHVGVPSWVQEIVIGAVIVLAVWVDYIRRRSTE